MLNLSINIQEECKNENLTKLKWAIEKPRRHWKLTKHCQDVLLPKSLPNIPLLTDDTKIYWHIYLSKGQHDEYYQRDLKHILGSTLLKTLIQPNLPLKHILISDRLINLQLFDIQKRKLFIHRTANVIRKQSELEIVCLEGLKLLRAEGYELLSALSNSEKCIKFLHIWRLFRRNEYSLPERKASIKNFPCQKNLTHNYHWSRAIRRLNYLEIISLNYSYIATEDGDILILLAKQLRKNWKRLQLLCLDEEIPETVNGRGNKNPVTIPDFAWNEARKWAPKLKVQLVLLGVTDYDLQKRFLTQSIPMHTIVLSNDVKLLHHKPCMIDCTLRIVYLWYNRGLVQLHLNLWNHREALDNHLRKILACLPNLEVFEFIGKLKDSVTIFTMCCQIKIGTCATKRLHMQLQRPLNVTRETDEWLSQVQCTLNSFKDLFKTMGVVFDINRYPL